MKAPLPSRNFDLPLALQRRGIYYGWVILFAGTVGVVMSVPGQTMGVSVYTDFLLNSLGLSRIQLSTAYMTGTLASGLALPWAGRLLDRFGSRAVATSASILLALGIFSLASSPYLTNRIENATGWIHERVAFGVALLCFFGIRHFGQGQLTIASRTMMARWFERRRGLMLGFSGLFVAIAFGLAPLVLTGLIHQFGWQESLCLLAGLSLVMALFAWVFFRNSPEQSGLRMDGERANSGSGKTLLSTRSLTAKEAQRTFTFWAFNLGFVSQAMFVTAITFHMSHIGKLSGMSNLAAFSVFFYLSLVSAGSELIAGYLSDRIPIKYLLGIMQLGICAGLIALGSFGTSLGFGFVALGLGISNGLFSLLIGAAWVKLFGRTHLGAISGINMAWIVCGSAVGPFLFSIGEGIFGGYTSVLYLSAVYPALVFLGSFFADAP